MQMIPVASTAIAAIGYEVGSPYVAFRQGGTYRYFGVPENIASQFFYAASKGRFYRQFIQGKWPSIRIR